jgi:hypothetical protein
MTMTTRTTFREHALAAVAAGVAVIAQVAGAQVPLPEPSPDPARDHTVFFVANAMSVVPFGGTVDIIAGAGSVMGKVVVDKPYSAAAITESTQVLADGNRITQRNETRIYRDSEGRTRREQTLSALGVWQTANEPATMITIDDPVAEVSYFVDPRTETVRELKPFKLAHGMVISGAEGAMHVPPPNAGGPGVTVAVSDFNVAIEAEAGAAPALSVEPFELPVPPPVAGVRAFPPMAATAISAFNAAETITEDLGEQILEGVRAHGTRHTQTIAAGAIGNERPIEIVTEQWYSAEIEAEVLRRHVDPRFGETTYRLVNVVLGEPSADLFVVPEGYKVQSEGAPLVHREFRLEATPETTP